MFKSISAMHAKKTKKSKKRKQKCKDENVTCNHDNSGIGNVKEGPKAKEQSGAISAEELLAVAMEVYPKKRGSNCRKKKKKQKHREECKDEMTAIQYTCVINTVVQNSDEASSVHRIKKHKKKKKKKKETCQESDKVTSNVQVLSADNKTNRDRSVSKMESGKKKKKMHDGKDDLTSDAQDVNSDVATKSKKKKKRKRKETDENKTERKCGDVPASQVKDGKSKRKRKSDCLDGGGTAANVETSSHEPSTEKKKRRKNCDKALEEDKISELTVSPGGGKKERKSKQKRKREKDTGNCTADVCESAEKIDSVLGVEAPKKKKKKKHRKKDEEEKEKEESNNCTETVCDSSLTRKKKRHKKVKSGSKSTETMATESVTTTGNSIAAEEMRERSKKSRKKICDGGIESGVERQHPYMLRQRNADKTEPKKKGRSKESGGTCEKSDKVLSGRKENISPKVSNQTEVKCKKKKRKKDKKKDLCNKDNEHSQTGSHSEYGIQEKVSDEDNKSDKRKQSSPSDGVMTEPKKKKKKKHHDNVESGKGMKKARKSKTKHVLTETSTSELAATVKPAESPAKTKGKENNSAKKRKRGVDEKGEEADAPESKKKKRKCRKEDSASKVCNDSVEDTEASPLETNAPDGVMTRKKGKAKTKGKQDSGKQSVPTATENNDNEDHEDENRRVTRSGRKPQSKKIKLKAFKSVPTATENNDNEDHEDENSRVTRSGRKPQSKKTKVKAGETRSGGPGCHGEKSSGGAVTQSDVGAGDVEAETCTCKTEPMSDTEEEQTGCVTTQTQMIICKTEPVSDDEQIDVQCANNPGRQEQRTAINGNYTTTADNDTRSSHSTSAMGQWSTASFQTTREKDKFFRLLGMRKKGAEPKATPRETRSNYALSHQQSGNLNDQLESQYCRALSMKWDIKKGFGLGYAEQERVKSKKFHIDKDAVRSVKFED